MWPSKYVLVAMATFAAAAVMGLGAATVSVQVIERQTKAAIVERLQTDGHRWAEVETDGLLVTIRGESPTEAARFRALSLAGTVIDGARVLDEVVVTPGLEIALPVFQMEILRSGNDVSLIGLVPASRGTELVASRLEAIGADVVVADMLESADHPVPDGWDSAVSFALEAVRMLPMSKLSVAADRIEVSALASDEASRRELETRLRQARPSGVEVLLEISAPREVVTPFTLRFTAEDGAMRFDACVADTEAAYEAIVNAARAAGVSGVINCAIAMGTPTPRWSEAVVPAIGAVATLGAGVVTISDTDISLLVPGTVSQTDFDRVAGQLESRLPDVFALEAVRLRPEEDPSNDMQEALEFRVVLTGDGLVQMTGRLTNERIRDAVRSFARARFGLETVEMAARLDADLPEGWPLKALTAIEALAELEHGQAQVRADRIELRGVSGNRDANTVIARLLSEKLGAGADFRINVTYDEALDPASQIPTPERCEGWIREILSEGQISFAPGSARIDSEAAQTLDRIAGVMRECGALEMEIGGHTDSQGAAETNLALSQRRAEAVLDALMGRQVLVSGLVAKGYGAEHPIADNATAAGREANRRIEFRLLSRIGQPGVVPRERDPELEAQLEIRVTEGAGSALRPLPRPER